MSGPRAVATGPRPSRTFDVAGTVHAVERRLQVLGTRARAAGSRAYLKSTLTFTGTDVPTVRREVTTWHRGHDHLPIASILRLVDALWRRGIFELQLYAAELLVLEVDRLTPRHLARIERLVRESRTWALVDVLAPRVVGPLLTRHRAAVGPVLDRWAGDADFWTRRAALLALLLPMRRGDGDWPRFTRYAGALAADREFFVRKAIGWVLRDAATRQPDEVVTFLEPRVGVLSGVTWREAVKKLPAGTRRRLERRRQRATTL